LALHAEAKALADKFNREHGAGSLFLASEMQAGGTFTTGSLSLDLTLGGGWPANHWSEIIGEESHGKTAVTLKTVAANQRRDPDFTTFWVAAEHYDYKQAEALGVNNDQVQVLSTQDMVLAYEAMLEFANNRASDLIVLDSYPALIAPEEEEKAMDEAVVAIGARMTGKFFRKAGGATKRDHFDPDDRPMMGIVINQWRDKIGWSPTGHSRTTPGGNAKNYAYYVRAEISRDDWIHESIADKGKIKVGQTIKLKTTKNKQAAPQQTGLVDFYFRDAPAHGFKRGDYDTVKELAIMGSLYGVIVRKGAYYEYNGHRLAEKSSKEAALAAIRQDPALQESIAKDIHAAHDSAREQPLSEPEVEAAAAEGKRSVRRRKES